MSDPGLSCLLSWTDHFPDRYAQPRALHIKKSIRQHNRSLFLFSLFLIPLTNITILSGYFTSVTIPDFILYYIRSNQPVFHVLCVILVICLLLAIRYCLSLHCYCLEPGSFKEARAHCKKLTKRHYFHTALQLLAWNILILAVLAVILLLCFVLSLFFVRFVLADHFNSSTVYMIFSSILSFLFELYILFSVPLTFSYLSALYYRQLLKQKEEVPAPVPESRSVLVRISKRLLLLLVILAACFNFYYLDLLKDTNIFRSQNILLSTPVITAHRGDSHNAPENTIAAFQSAIDNQADCIELDVQQTKDHVIVVVHDTNLKRLTGIDKNVSDLTYEELLSLDFGSHFSPAYKGEKICTLDEVLTLCKDRIDLNIELKTNISDTGLEAGVVALIESHDYAEHCVVVAKKLDSLKKNKNRWMIPSRRSICYLLLTEITRTSAISMVSVLNLHLLPVSWSIICMQTAKQFMPGQSMNAKTWSACSASVLTV